MDLIEGIVTLIEVVCALTNRYTLTWLALSLSLSILLAAVLGENFPGWLLVFVCTSVLVLVIIWWRIDVNRRR